MSVIKWIHVNHGDAALAPLFARFASLLAEEGLLILEPQPWASYKKRKLSPEAKRIYESIVIRPDAFPAMILAADFTLVASLAAPELLSAHEHDEQGGGPPGNFKDREILIFQKTRRSQPSVRLMEGLGGYKGGEGAAETGDLSFL